MPRIYDPDAWGSHKGLINKAGFERKDHLGNKLPEGFVELECQDCGRIDKHNTRFIVPPCPKCNSDNIRRIA